MLVSIGFIPDGNRRYAKKHNITLEEAYKRGIQKALEVARWLKKRKEIKVGSFYAFSLKNLNRSLFERKILAKIFEKEFQRLKESGIFEELGAKIRFIGRTNVLGSGIEKIIKEIEKRTANYNELLINIAFGYDGKTEIVDASKRIALATLRGELRIDEINEETFKNFLYENFKEPDLIIRTSGEQRLSGFLTYMSSYSELYFCKKLWPEFEKEDLERAIESFYTRERRFGK